MLRLKRCREILGSASREMSDEDLRSLRSQLSALAEIIVTSFEGRKGRETESDEVLSDDDPEWLLPVGSKREVN